MSDKTPTDLTLERVNRLSQAMADLMESHAAQGKSVLTILEHMKRQLDGIQGEITALTKEVRNLASEQALLGNRVENAFHQAFRAHLRMDDMEGAPR